MALTSSARLHPRRLVSPSNKRKQVSLLRSRTTEPRQTGEFAEASSGSFARFSSSALRLHSASAFRSRIPRGEADVSKHSKYGSQTVPKHPAALFCSFDSNGFYFRPPRACGANSFVTKVLEKKPGDSLEPSAEELPTAHRNHRTHQTSTWETLGFVGTRARRGRSTWKKKPPTYSQKRNSALVNVFRKHERTASLMSDTTQQRGRFRALISAGLADIPREGRPVPSDLGWRQI